MSTSSSPGQAGTGKAILLALNTCLSKGEQTHGLLGQLLFPEQPNPLVLPSAHQNWDFCYSCQGTMPGEELRAMEKGSPIQLQLGSEIRSAGEVHSHHHQIRWQNQWGKTHLPPVLSLYSSCSSSIPSKCIVLSQALQLSPQLYQPGRTHFSRCCREAMKFHLSCSEFLWLSLCYAYPTECH